MTRPLGAIERKGRALELEGHGGAVGSGDMVRALEELILVRVRVGLDGPASRVREGRIGVVDGEVHVSGSDEGVVWMARASGEGRRWGDRLLRRARLDGDGAVVQRQREKQGEIWQRGTEDQMNKGCVVDEMGVGVGMVGREECETKRAGSVSVLGASTSKGTGSGSAVKGMWAAGGVHGGQSGGPRMVPSGGRREGKTASWSGKERARWWA